MLRWIVPPLLALALYWPGLLCWFQKDDFAWLGLFNMIHSWADFWNAMFHPYAQGTVRTLSERVFFTLFYAMFGLHALPYRILPFVTHIANLTLINAIGTKLSGGSRAVGFWAAILWTINSNMAYALAWTAIYYELLCALVFLLSLWLLMRYAETNDRRFLAGQWAAYLTGFLVLEQNVVYPAIALVYAWCFARPLMRKVYPMFVPATLYTLLHFWVAPPVDGGPYRMFWNSSVFSTLWMYWKIALGPIKLINVGIHPSLGRSALVLVLTAALLGWVLSRVLRRDWKAAFGAAWFFIVLAPLLPLRDHISDYYLTIPLAGLALWGAMALQDGWRRGGRLGKVATAVLLVIYAAVNIPLARVNVMSFYHRSEDIRTIVEGVASEGRSHPGKPIVLTGVAPEIFWSAIVHRPFRLYGVDQVYVSEGDRPAIDSVGSGLAAGDFFVESDLPGARVLDLSGGRIRVVTGN